MILQRTTLQTLLDCKEIRKIRMPLTILQLESELIQKTYELHESLNAQYLLREILKSNTKTLHLGQCNM